jgi:putative Mg2+ transporter-C (MgtC) family protein
VNIDIADALLRLGVAAAIGLAIGLERELRGHLAGVGTHALVTLGAAMFTMAGAYAFTDTATGAVTAPDRIAAQVASGIGFIGAGAILRIGLDVRGLTTAASLWLSAAAGVAVGAGGIWFGLLGAAIALVVLTSRVLLKGLLSRSVRCTLRVGYVLPDVGADDLGREVKSHLLTAGAKIGRMRVTGDENAPSSRRRTALFEFQGVSLHDLEAYVGELLARADVWDVDLDETGM